LPEKAVMTDSFILGLSSGSACLVTCGIVMFPYLMSGSAGVKRIAADLSVFMLTRLVIYFILATLAWFFGQAIFTNPLMRNVVPGILYILFAVLLVWYSIGRNRKIECSAKIVTTVHNRKLIPIFLGVVNSLGFCPALYIILIKGATQSTMVQSYMAFLAFFIGSSLWFLPLPLAGKIKKKKVLETIGILATGLAGTIFIIKGITSLIGGLINE
jgi:sulfite exporter TauE/SafE